MPDPSVSALAAWNGFYVIVGSSAAALTGLMFVVVSLVPDSRTSASGAGIEAFGTPTVVHFCAALLMSGVICAPWPRLWQAGIAIFAIGVAGVLYAVLVTQRAKRQKDYAPVFEDWLWHSILPAIAYAAFVLSAALLKSNVVSSLFVCGGAAMLLLFIGIHNAWDTVTYMAIERLKNMKHGR